MSEFLKQMVLLGVLSLLALTQGVDTHAAIGNSMTTEDPAEIAVNVDGIANLPTDQSAPIPLETPAARAGVTVVQSNINVSHPMDVPRSSGNPSRVQNEGPVSELPPATLSPTPEPACRMSPTQGYGSLGIRGGPADRPAALQPDLNLGQRAWTGINASLSLQSVGGPTDGSAPRFSTLFAPSRMPRIVGAYQVFNWDFRSGRRTTPVSSPEVTLLGFATATGETLVLPESGYSIGDGYSALVLYADTMRITLKYTREDNVAVGYTLHLENICVDPRLLASYRYLNALGRRQLPAIRGQQPIGDAMGAQLLAGIQDSGSWMDPRSRKDWWQ